MKEFILTLFNNNWVRESANIFKGDQVSPFRIDSENIKSYRMLIYKCEN